MPIEDLKKHNLRVTKGRLAVLSILKESEHPLTIDEIQEQLSQREVMINLSTVYRILEQFEQSHLLLKSTPMPPFPPLYEYRDEIHSHHLICLRCGEILRIENCPIHEYEEKIAIEKGYLIQAHRFELYGLCTQCQKERQHGTI